MSPPDANPTAEHDAAPETKLSDPRLPTWPTYTRSSFESRAQALLYRKKILFQPPLGAEDTGLPRDDEEKFNYMVRDCVEAMCNMSDIKDNIQQCLKGTRRLPIMKKDQYTLKDIEAAVTEALCMAIDLHENGCALNPPDGVERDMDFLERWDAFCTLVCEWKSAAQWVMDGVKTLQLLVAPIKASNMRRNNQSSNKRKKIEPAAAKPQESSEGRKGKKRAYSSDSNPDSSEFRSDVPAAAPTRIFSSLDQHAPASGLARSPSRHETVEPAVTGTPVSTSVNQELQSQDSLSETPALDENIGRPAAPSTWSRFRSFVPFASPFAK